MADRTFEFEPEQRLQILNLLPKESGSLRESIQIKRLRDEIAFSDEEREKIDMDDQTGSFDPMKLQQLEDKEVKLGEGKLYILAGSFVKKEDEGEVPTNDTFVELALKLEDEIEEFRKDLDQ